MPGMVHADGSPASLSSLSHSSLSSTLSQSSLSSPLQSFSSLTLSPLSNGISPQHLQMMAMGGTHLASPFSPSNFPLSWVQELKSEERGLLIIQLLLKCASSVAANQIDYTNHLLEQLSLLASLTGDPMQRVATHFMEGLAARTTKAWPGLYKALNCTHLASPSEILTCRQIFFNLCPYLKFAFTLVNHSILEAMEGEKVVHIIDLGASEAVQWVALLQMLRTRIGGPPHLRITIINHRKDVLDQVGQKLCEEAENLDIPFQFHPLVARLEDVDIEMLRVKTGEAVAVSAVLQLHRLLMEEHPDGNLRSGVNCVLQRYAGMMGDVDGDRTLRELFEKEGKELNSLLRCKASAGTDVKDAMMEEHPSTSKADRLLSMLRGVLPKVMVLMEGEANINGGDFMERFVEALHYYGAVFDSLESSLPSKLAGERLMMERHMFGRAIHNIVACEGMERVERQERIPSWMKRVQAAGFLQSAFSYASLIHAKRILSSYTSSEGYKLVEDHGCLTVCWQETPLFSASAWHA
ncbi:hypothetical protein GOP47_0022205 [Adiantum capillus-veneris]|uniref:Scarecrow-like protein 3 n=1 Tax=Adiantum capillus-veneris TaxID=13818 RepID=A0A9D4U8Y6_ADICA|nr:hypothetical protein GOP47_0022205 [Adiantum capillus-veneris]